MAEDTRPPLERREWRGNELRRLRVNTTFDGVRQASQRDLGEAIGVSVNRYHQLERGIAVATKDERAALARVFGVSQRALRLGPEAPPRRNIRVVVRDESRQLRRA